jgi:hypothetical protein
MPKRWARPRDAKHANALRRRVPKTLRVRLLLRCNLLTYFKNFLSSLRPPVQQHRFDAPRTAATSASGDDGRRGGMG